MKLRKKALEIKKYDEKLGKIKELGWKRDL